MRGPNPPAGRSAFTLLEAAVSVGLLLVLAGIVTVALSNGSLAVETETRATALDAQARAALDEVASLLESASLATAAPTPARPFSTSELDFQRSAGIVDGAVRWGAPERLVLAAPWDAPGDDDDERGSPGALRLLRIVDPGGPGESASVVVDGVAPYLEGEEPNGVDDNGNGLIDERGFCLEFDDERVTVRLTLRRRGAEGLTVTSTLQRVVAFRIRGS